MNLLSVRQLSKQFTLHQQGAVQLPVLDNIDLEVNRGECLVLSGASGQGKSTLLRCLYANYSADSGQILLKIDDNSIDLLRCDDRSLAWIRRNYIAYVSQFLHVIPRVSALNIVMQPLLDSGMDQVDAEQKAAELLAFLQIPQNLWSLSPTTFSGGEQQRINIAREFVRPKPLMLLDEPTASLDERNRQKVIELILSAKRQGSAIIGIFHDQTTREQVADRSFELPGRSGTPSS